ncbi:MAG TPA: 50S ribosomal protein L22 [Candidatus Micrarchaeota archaeon]|nr:50S ribosomal protein L22 [Candidatus Micrarchaeota archaeon]
MAMAYAFEFQPEKKYAKAKGEDINISYKHAVAVCSNIRYKATEDAIALLEIASRGEMPILYTANNKKMGHREELGGRKGKYPVKAASLILGVLKNAHANAQRLGLGQTKVKHASANKQTTYPRVAAKGRWTRQNYETAIVEIVLEETTPAKAVEKKAPAAAAPMPEKTAEAKHAEKAASEAKKQEAPKLMAGDSKVENKRERKAQSTTMKQ